SRLGQIGSGGAPYPVFAYAALVPWFFFSNTVSTGMMSVITYRNIVTKTYFPREIIPLAQVTSRLLDFCASAALFVVMLWLYRLFLVLNPLTSIIEGSRNAILFNRAPDWSLVGLGGGIIAVLLVVSVVVFKTLDRYFADVI